MKDAEKFKTWLGKRGAVVMPPTNPWEVVRFNSAAGIGVVYTNKSGHLTFTGESEKAYEAYKGNKPWKAVSRQRQALRAKKAKLAARDGKKCFFHGQKLNFDELTIEHLLSFSHGGSDHEDNLCLACEPCNRAVGNLSITQKMLYRDQQLGKFVTLVSGGTELKVVLPEDLTQRKAF